MSASHVQHAGISVQTKRSPASVIAHVSQSHKLTANPGLMRAKLDPELHCLRQYACNADWIDVQIHPIASNTIRQSALKKDIA